MFMYELKVHNLINAFSDDLIPTAAEVFANGLKCLQLGGGIRCLCKDLPNCNLVLLPPKLGVSADCPTSGADINQINLVVIFTIPIVAAIISV